MTGIDRINTSGIKAAQEEIPALFVYLKVDAASCRVHLPTQERQKLLSCGTSFTTHQNCQISLKSP